jgi:26S proteasome regulatory subunit N5
MDRREKTEFILEQMRLLIAVARLKDAELDKNGKEVLGGGESEWVKVRVGGRKINEEFLKEKDNEVRASAIAFSIIASSQPPGSQTEVL